MKAVWKRPTRRTFLGLLGVAAAAAVVKLPTAAAAKKPAKVAAKLPRWIGHG